MSNKYTDKKIQEALGGLEFPFQEQDWEEMNARLDEEKKKTSKFFFYRTMEAVVLLLAVVTLVEFVSFNQTGTDQSIIESTKITAPAIQTKVPVQETKIKTDIIETAPKIKAQSNQTTPPVAAKKLPSSSTTAIAQKSFNSTKTNKTNFTPTTLVNSALSTNNVSDQKVYVNSIPNTQSSTLASDPEMTISSAPLPSKLDFTPSKEAIKQSLSVNSISGKLSKLAWNENNLEINLEDLPAQYNPGDPLPKLKKFRAWNLKLYFSPEMNGKKNNNNIGFAFGGLITKEIANGLNLGGGISYSNKTFTYDAGELMPTSINPVQLMNIKHHHVEVPMELEYTIKESVNWRPYVVGGLSSNFVMYTEYDFDIIGNVEKPSTLNHVYPSYTKGILSGGNVIDNTYFTANIGLGLERQLDNNLHLFIQPMFKYALNGITGMNRKSEKINTISLIMGARTTL